ncbi:MAG TPA: DUF502 domain-containing protein [Epsilonproteobacteria bacterium]|mgnify:CR=1 FL=1|nr:DUF502 domain-containing protein [Campylobacterota bacterium]
MEKPSNKIVKHIAQTTLKGLFWVLPMALIFMVVMWIYDKVRSLIGDSLWSAIGFNPEHHEGLWIVAFVVLFMIFLYIVGHLIETRLAIFFERLISKIPGYGTIKDIINIFNSSKQGNTKVLVVAINGFGNKDAYNIGLMYSQKESIIKDHYTITLSMSPIPNGGFMFEVHKDDIYVIEEASFDDNLQYLLSMGVKSMAEILKTEPKDIKNLPTLEAWLAKQ